jgi:hypothetical protein
MTGVEIWSPSSTVRIIVMVNHNQEVAKSETKVLEP